MRKTVQVASNYGPVDVKILLCDNDICKSVVQEPLAVGWFQLFNLGYGTVMSDIPEEAHLCSLACLKECIL